MTVDLRNVFCFSISSQFTYFYNMIQALRFFTITGLFLCTITLSAQTQPIEPEEQDKSATEKSDDKPAASWKDRFVVGGNVGAQFGQQTYIEMSPIIGYRITEMFTAGVGLTYQYFKVNYNSPAIIDDYKATVIGPRAFLQHDLIYNFFAHTEFEHTWVKFTYEDAAIGEATIDASAFFVGGGYNYMIGDDARFQIMVLYDLLNGINSIYYSPWVVRMGFNVGL